MESPSASCAAFCLASVAIALQAFPAPVGARSTSEARDSNPKVFCFFSSEKKAFLPKCLSGKSPRRSSDGGFPDRH
jgi:hypothetical protein